MIYLIYIPSSPSFSYWIITNTQGAAQSAATPIQAIANFERQMFKLKDRKNNYIVTEHEVLSNGKFNGRILAKANTIQSLVHNYLEYFI